MCPYQPKLFRVNNDSSAGPHADRIRGCLLGGALGDALGFAPGDQDAEPGLLRFSSGTQLTLYTVDGLVDALEWANDGVAADETACLWLAYLRWLATQGEAPPSHAPVPPPRWIDAQVLLRQRRAPCPASISGLRSGEMGTRKRPVNPGAADAGTVARSAPFGLLPYVPADTLDRIAMDAAALTHGHPSAHHSAAVVCTLVRSVVTGSGTLREAVADAVTRAQVCGIPELGAGIETAVSRADAGAEPGTGCHGVDGSTGAVDALAAAVYAVLAGDTGDGPQEHFRAAVALAADDGGSAAGALAGGILGAFYGRAALPGEWLAVLEGADVVTAMADALVRVTVGDGPRPGGG